MQSNPSAGKHAYGCEGKNATDSKRKFKDKIGTKYERNARFD